MLRLLRQGECETQGNKTNCYKLDALHVRFWMYLSWLAEEHADFAVPPRGGVHHPTLVCRPTVEIFQSMFKVDSPRYHEFVSICNGGGLFTTLSRQLFERNFISAVIEYMVEFIDAQVQ
jgi:hypothetical protein